MTANPTEAPREKRCPVCTLVQSPMDVTIRLFTPQMEYLPLKDAIDYLRSVGLAGTNRQMTAKCLIHRRHIEKWASKGAVVVPARLESGIQRLERSPNTTWIDSNQRAMDVGEAALGLVESRLPRMEDKDLIAVAKIGQTAVATRATLEQRGAIRRAEEIAKLASGFDDDE